MAKFINGWNALNKQKDKVNVTLRVSILTIFSLQLDVSDKSWKVVICNVGFSNSKPAAE